MHPELDSVERRKCFQKGFQRGLCVGNQIRCVHAPDQARRRPAQSIVAQGRTAVLHIAAINVIPDADGEIDSARVRHRDEPVEGFDILLLLRRRDADHFNFGEFRHIKKIRITRREKAAVLVT